MAKFKVSFSCSYNDNYKKNLEKQLDNIYIENKEYLDTIPNEITLSFNKQGGEPLIALTCEKNDTKYHMEEVRQLLDSLKLS